MDRHLPAKPNGHMRGVTHHVSHRTRYRLASHHRNNEMVNRLHESLKKVPGVKKVEYNDRTGSLLVHHESMPGVIGILGTVFDNIANDLFEELAEEEICVVPEVSLFAHLLGKRFDRVNQYVARRTNNYLDLKMLLPLLFMGAGLYQISKERGAFSQVPAWVLFYYAYDSYLKFHNMHTNGSVAQIPGNGHGHKGLQ